MKLSKVEFNKIVRSSFKDDNGHMVVFLFLNAIFTKMELKRYFIYVLHHLKWIDLRIVSVKELGERDLCMSVIYHVEGLKDEVITEENLFQLLGVSRQSFKLNYSNLLEKYDTLSIENVVKIIDKWTDGDWSKLRGIPLGKFQKIVDKLSEENYYPKKIQGYLTDKKIKEKFNEFGHESRKVRVLPPIIVQILLYRYFDPDEVDYVQFLTELDKIED